MGPASSTTDWTVIKSVANATCQATAERGAIPTTARARRPSRKTWRYTLPATPAPDAKSAFADSAICTLVNAKIEGRFIRGHDEVNFSKPQGARSRPGD